MSIRKPAPEHVGQPDQPDRIPAASPGAEADPATTRTDEIVAALKARRQGLVAQLDDTRSRRPDLVEQVEEAQQAWRDALAAGEDDLHLLAERRKHRQAELDGVDEATAQLRAWVGEVDEQLQARAPHQLLDQQVVEFRRDIDGFAELAAAFGEGAAVDLAADQVASIAHDLHAQVVELRTRGDALAARAADLRARAAQLDRGDVTIPAPADWYRRTEEGMRGSPTARLWAATGRHAPGVAEALGAQAARMLQHHPGESAGEARSEWLAREAARKQHEREQMMERQRRQVAQPHPGRTALL